MKTQRFSLLAAASLLACVVFAAPAHAVGGVVCGQTVTTSVTLSADVGPCTGDGIIVQGTGITVNLAGHTVRGSGDRSDDQVGVRVENSTNVVVTSGAVTAFATGVALENTTGSTVRAIRAFANTSDGLSNHGDGILLDGSSNNTVIGNDVSANGPYDGIGMVDGSNGNLVKGNFVHDNTLVRAAPRNDQEDMGIRLDTDTSSDTIDGNRIIGNGSDGVGAPAFPHADNKLINNIIEGNGGLGTVELGVNYLISNNFIANNGFDQFEVPGQPKSTSDGVLVFANFCTCVGVVQHNVIQGNANDGIDVLSTGFVFQGEYHPPIVLTIADNVVTNNGSNGIAVSCDFLADAFPDHVCLASSPPHQGQQILRNTASGNGGKSAASSAWDLFDESPHCDSNHWSGNSGRFVNQPCTLAR